VEPYDLHRLLNFDTAMKLDLIRAGNADPSGREV
jgi:hypothetical protein